MTIPESALPQGAKEGKNSHDQRSYRGPCPKGSDDRHYDFTVYALEESPSVDEGATWSDVLEAVEGADALLSRSTLTGTYGADCAVPTGAVPLDQLLNVRQACLGIRTDKLQEEVTTLIVPRKVSFEASDSEGPLPGSITVNWSGYELADPELNPNDPFGPDESWNTTFILEEDSCVVGDVCYPGLDADDDGIPDSGEATLCAVVGSITEFLGEEAPRETGTCRDEDYIPPVDVAPWPREVTLIPSHPLDLLEEILDLLPDDGAP